MTTLPTARAVALHEAFHAAALLLAGLGPTEARIDWPNRDDAGLVSIDWGEDGINPERARAALHACLLGPVADGETWEDWPIDPDRMSEGCRQDAEHAASLADYLKLDEVGFRHEVSRARRLARRPEFRRLVVAIARELERVEVLSGDDLEALAAKARSEN